MLALAMALCCLPAAFAAEDEITISFSFFDGAVVIPKGELKVTDGIAEKYGYQLSEKDHNGNEINGITVFDAIVAAHESYYGSSFTAETSGDYLSMTGGFITKAFGKATSALGFCVNDAVPHDDIYIDAYGGYTGYSSDTALIKSNDYVSLYTYKDSYYADYYITPDKSEISVQTNEEFTLSVKGYSVMYYGCSKDENREAMTNPMAGLSVYATKDFKLYSALGTLDENGSITLSFDKPETVYLCIMGDFEDPALGTVPVVANWCKVTITEPAPTPDPEPAPAPDPEPETDDSFYLPKNISAKLNADPDNGTITLTVNFYFADIKGNAPDKSEYISITVNISWFSRIIEFIAGVL